MKNQKIDIYQLKELLSYDKETGVFTWEPSAPKKVRGKQAGTVNDCGYLIITIKGKKYQASRLAWAYHYNEDPVDRLIDHINRNPLDNRIDNLRLASYAENNINRVCLGICKSHPTKDKSRWGARIIHQGVSIWLGTYDCPLMARIAYEDKHRELHGSFSPF